MINIDELKILRCYFCKGRDRKDKLIRKQKMTRSGKPFKTKDGSEIFQYFHPECLAIKDNKNLNCSKPYSSETELHRKSKFNLHEGIVKNDTLLIDQFGNEHKLVGEYSSVESPVIVEHNDRLSYIDKDTCNSCINTCLGNENDYEKHKNKINVTLSKIGEKTPIFKECEGQSPMSKWGMNRLRTRDSFSYLDCPTVRERIE